MYKDNANSYTVEIYTEQELKEAITAHAQGRNVKIQKPCVYCGISVQGTLDEYYASDTKLRHHQNFHDALDQEGN